MYINLEILQWIVFIVYLIFFNIGWIYGCRHNLKTKGGFSHATGATTMLMTFTSVVFLFSNINKLHLLWLTPFFIFISGSINLKIFSIPYIGKMYLGITLLFTKIITIGVKTNKNPDEYIINVLSQTPGLLGKDIKPNKLKEELLRRRKMRGI